MKTIKVLKKTLAILSATVILSTSMTSVFAADNASIIEPTQGGVNVNVPYENNVEETTEPTTEKETEATVPPEATVPKETVKETTVTEPATVEEKETPKRNEKKNKAKTAKKDPYLTFTVPNVQVLNEDNLAVNLAVTYTVNSKNSTAGKFEFTWVGWKWTITKSENHPVDGTTYILNFDAAKQEGATTNKAVFPDFKVPTKNDDGTYTYHTPWQQPLSVVEALSKEIKDKLTGKNWATQDYCERLIFSNNIGNIGSYAFYNYHNGRYINFGNSVQTINDYAFANAGSELSTSKNQTIAYLQPSNVVMQHIGKYAFSGCHYLTSCINTAALDGKDWRSTQYTWSTIQDTKQIGTSSGTTTLNLKTFKLPSSVKSIGEEAFGNCERIQEIDWYGEPSDLEIEERAFCNISQLRYVYIPNSLDKIPKLAFYLDVNHSMLNNEGKFYPALLNEVNGMKRTDQTISNNKVSTPGTAGKYLYRLTTAAINERNGTVNKGKDPTRYNMANQKMYIAINSTYSKLEEIGTQAFDISCESGATRAVLYNVSTGQEVSSTTKFVFPKLKYIGYRSFMNNFTFTGIIQSNVNIIIKGRAFVNTDLTDLYFKYNGDIDGTDITQSSGIIKNSSSVIGSSNIYIQNPSKNHGYNHTPSANDVPSGYMSLQELINDNLTNSTSAKSASVTGHWDSKFDALKSVGKTQDDWTTNAPSTLHTASTGKVPKITKGVMNNYKVNKATTPGWSDYIRTFLSAKTSWAKKNKADATDDADDAVKAIEEVKFGYTSEKKVDVVVVMDNSPSMDEACSSSEYKDAQVFTTIRNAARSINTAAMTYLIAKKICSGAYGNTISIVSFNGNSVNALQDSSKQIGTTGMTSPTIVKSHLFKSEQERYTDGGVTNYSAGLSRAYQILTELKNNTATKDHEKVVLFMSDGSPTGTKSIYNSSQNRVSFETIGWSPQKNAEIVRKSSITDIKEKIAKQNNGILWARAIKGTNTVACPKYDTSYVTGLTDTKGNPITDTRYYPIENSTTENVAGLGVPIYSIMIGADGYGSDLYEDTLDTLSLISSDNEPNLTTNDITNKTFDRTKVIETREMEKGIEDIVNAVRAASSEKISIVIPLSSSFRPAYKTNGSFTNRYTFGVNTNASSSTYTTADQDGRRISGESKSTYVEHAKITSTSFTENVGNIKYSENRNAFIWTFDAAVGYNMYSVKIPLRYQKGTANIATNSGKKYVAVTSNGTSNSLNGNYVDKQNTATRTITYCPPKSESPSSQTYSMTANTNNGTTSTTSGNNITNTSGVYAYVSDKYADINRKEAEYTNGSTTYEVGNGYLQEVGNSKARILNWAQAQYLPLGDASIKKVKESTTTALAGAQFEIYGAMSDNDDQEQIYRKIKFKNTGSTGKYNYADENETGTVTALSTPSSGKDMGILNIYGLSPGTYYVREIKFPAGYGNIDNITPYTIKVPNGENKETTTVQCYYKFQITGGNKTTQMVNSNKTKHDYIPNKETNMTITGIKYDQSKAVMAECIFGLYLSSTNAANNTNCLATATSGSDGKFTFTVNQSDIFTNNATSKTIYVKETSGPSNYLLDNRIISATITKKTNAVYDLTSTLAFYNVLGRDISIHVSAPCYSSTYNGSSLSKAGFKFTLTPYYYNKQSNTEVSLANDARFGTITLTTDSTGVATTSGTNTYIYRRVCVAQPSGSTADPLRDVYYKIARTTGASNCKNPLWNEWGTSWSDTNASNTEDRGISLFDNTPNAVVNTSAGQYTSGVAKGEAHRHVYVYLPQLITRYYNYRSNTSTRIQTRIKLNENAVTIKKSGVGYEQKWDSNSSKSIQQTEVPQYYMALKQAITVNPNITPSSTSALKTDSVAIASGSDTTKHRYYLYNINIYNPLIYDTPVAGGFDNSNQVQTTAIYILLGAIMLITIVSGSILLRRPKSFTYYMR